MNQLKIKKISEILSIIGWGGMILTCIVGSIITCIGFKWHISVWLCLFIIAVGCIVISALIKMSLKSERKDGFAVLLIFSIIFGGLTAVGVITHTVVQHIDSKYEDAAAPFVTHLQEYIDINGLADSNNSSPYISGKVLMIDILPEKEHRYDSFKELLRSRFRDKPWEIVNHREFLKLPTNLRATTPEDVGTIIWLKWGNITEGQYGKGKVSRGYAYRITCEATFIDKQNGLIVDKKLFQGGSPPQSVTGGGTHYGSRPTKQIVNYIISLPRKANDEHM